MHTKLPKISFGPPPPGSAEPFTQHVIAQQMCYNATKAVCCAMGHISELAVEVIVANDPAHTSY